MRDPKDYSAAVLKTGSEMKRRVDEGVYDNVPADELDVKVSEDFDRIYQFWNQVENG